MKLFQSSTTDHVFFSAVCLDSLMFLLNGKCSNMLADVSFYSFRIPLTCGILFEIVVSGMHGSYW